MAESVRSAACGIICVLRAVEQWWQRQKQKHPAKSFEMVNDEAEEELNTAFLKVLGRYNCVASVLGREFVGGFNGEKAYPHANRLCSL
jgi:hypothetical protein